MSTKIKGTIPHYEIAHVLRTKQSKAPETLPRPWVFVVLAGCLLVWATLLFNASGVFGAELPGCWGARVGGKDPGFTYERKGDCIRMGVAAITHTCELRKPETVVTPVEEAERASCWELAFGFVKCIPVPCKGEA